jgi:hypothetical protein
MGLWILISTLLALFACAQLWGGYQHEDEKAGHAMPLNDGVEKLEQAALIEPGRPDV